MQNSLIDGVLDEIQGKYAEMQAQYQDVSSFLQNLPR